MSAVIKHVAPWTDVLAYRCRLVCQHRWFHCVQFAMVISGLVVSDLWILIRGDVASLDAFLVFLLICFTLELFVQAIGRGSSYLWTFLFYMDIIGTCSLLLDMARFRKFIGLEDSVESNAVIMRAARAARLGARAGRFTRLVKLLRFLPGGFSEEEKTECTAKAITRVLITKLSTRVSCLIILLVMILPTVGIFTYPLQDWSMRMWSDHLAAALASNPTGSSEVQEIISDFRNSFAGRSYFPHTGWFQRQGAEEREVLWMERSLHLARDALLVKSGNLTISFDFGGVQRTEAAANLSMMFFTCLLMLGFSLVISNSINKIALFPLEQVFANVRTVGSAIYWRVQTMEDQSAYRMSNIVEAKPTGRESNSSEANADDEEFAYAETALLERVVRKLAAVTELHVRHAQPSDDQTLQYLGEARGSCSQSAEPRRPSGTSSYHICVTVREEEADDDLQATRSWSFNALTLDRMQKCETLTIMLRHTGEQISGCDRDCLSAFVDAASSGYVKGPAYHNFAHAADVTHVMFMMLYKCGRFGRFMSPLEDYALLIAAVCHDIGHPGISNDFLIKTASDLAIRYNDTSPLENMHCARLFEILSKPKSAVLENLSVDQYKEARAICVAAILHTDNVHHMGMVKRLQMFGEANSEVLQHNRDVYYRLKEDADVPQSAQAKDNLAPLAESENWPTRELSDTMWDADHRTLFRNLLLHFCDISNPTRPFNICSEWAKHVLDEFFEQGDMERQRGLPVGPLNDRERTNFPFSQIGFIDFFVAPLVFATVRILAPLEELADQLLANTQMWVDQWLEQEHLSEEVLGVTARLQKLEERLLTLKVASKTKPRAGAEQVPNKTMSLRPPGKAGQKGRLSDRPVGNVLTSPASLGGGERRLSSFKFSMSVSRSASSSRRSSCIGP